MHTSSVGAIGVAKPGGTADETTAFEIGHLGLAYVNSKHEAELEALHLAARGLPVVIVNPTFVLGPDDPTGTSMGLVRRFLLAPDPGLRQRRAQHRRRPRRRGRSPARRREGRGGRALHPRRAQLHPQPPVRRPDPDLRRRLHPPLRLPASIAIVAAEAAQRARVPIAGRPRRGPLGVAVVDVPEHEGQARARLSVSPARGDARGGGRLAARAARGPLPGRRAAAARPRATGRLLGGLERAVGG